MVTVARGTTAPLATLIVAEMRPPTPAKENGANESTTTTTKIRTENRERKRSTRAPGPILVDTQYQLACKPRLVENKCQLESCKSLVTIRRGLHHSRFGATLGVDGESWGERA